MMLGYEIDIPLNIACAASLINFNGLKFGTYFTKHFPVVHCVLEKFSYTMNGHLLNRKEVLLTDELKHGAILIRTDGDSYGVKNASGIGNTFIVHSVILFVYDKFRYHSTKCSFTNDQYNKPMYVRFVRAVCLKTLAMIHTRF
jgi:hypothetical protein